MLLWSPNVYFFHLGVFLNFGNPLTTENTENKTAPKMCRIMLAQRISAVTVYGIML